MYRILLIPLFVAALVMTLGPQIASAKPATGCFPGPPSIASTVYQQLWKYSSSMDAWDGSGPLPSTTYGSCNVKDSKIYDARGKTIAHLHCGLEVNAKGIVDHLGLSVGDKGKSVLDRNIENGEVACISYFGGSRCNVEPQFDHDEPIATYIVAQRLPEGEILRGKKARAFFGRQRIKSFTMTMNCH